MRRLNTSTRWNSTSFSKHARPIHSSFTRAHDPAVKRLLAKLRAVLLIKTARSLAKTKKKEKKKMRATFKSVLRNIVMSTSNHSQPNPKVTKRSISVHQLKSESVYRLPQEWSWQKKLMRRLNTFTRWKSTSFSKHARPIHSSFTRAHAIAVKRLLGKLRAVLPTPSPLWCQQTITASKTHQRTSKPYFRMVNFNHALFTLGWD